MVTVPAAEAERPVEEAIGAAYARVHRVEDVLPPRQGNGGAESPKENCSAGRAAPSFFAALLRPTQLDPETQRGMAAMLQENMQTHFAPARWSRVFRDKKKELQEDGALHLLLYSSPPTNSGPFMGLSDPPGSPSASGRDGQGSDLEGKRGHDGEGASPAALGCGPATPSNSSEVQNGGAGRSSAWDMRGGANELHNGETWQRGVRDNDRGARGAGGHALDSSTGTACAKRKKEAWEAGDRKRGLRGGMLRINGMANVGHGPEPALQGESGLSDVAPLAPTPVLRAGARKAAEGTGTAALEPAGEGPVGPTCLPEPSATKTAAEPPEETSEPVGNGPAGHAWLPLTGTTENKAELRSASNQAVGATSPPSDLARMQILYLPEGLGNPADLCGFVHFRFVEEEGAAVLYIYEIQLGPGAQGQGLGSFLIEALCQLAARVGMAATALTVQRRNARALKFYTARHRFEVARHSPHKAPYVILWKKALLLL